MTELDSDQVRFTIPAAVLATTRALLAEPGEAGFEASALWIGHVLDEQAAQVTHVCRPEQIAYATSNGLAVELTEQGLTDLIRSLADDEIVLVRLHSHGNDDVNHSEIDDRNLVVAHPGAASIVVPRFASEEIKLDRCGVHILSEKHIWRRLSSAETLKRFLIHG